MHDLNNCPYYESNFEAIKKSINFYRFIFKLNVFYFNHLLVYFFIFPRTSQGLFMLLGTNFLEKSVAN